jgi:hypothetical protein
MKAIVFALFVGLTTATGSLAEWTVYTNVKHVRRLYVDSTYVYAATSGGLYRRLGKGTEPRVFNSGDGLGANDVRALARDGGDLWLGGDRAVLTRFNPVTGSASKYPLALGVSSITALEPSGDTLWVGTDIGVGVFQPNLGGGVFTDVYTRLGTLPAEPAIRDFATSGDRLFVATSFGIVSVLRSERTLHVPESWTTYADPDGALEEAYQLATVFDSVWVATEPGLYVLTDTGFVPRFTARRIRSLFAGVDTLWMGTDSGVYYRTRDTVYRFQALNLNDAPVGAVARVPGADLWVGFDGDDLFHHGSNDSWFDVERVNQPGGTATAGIEVSGGRVWCAYFGDGAGFLDRDGTWRSAGGITASPGSPLYSVASAGATVYYPGWGQGLYAVTPTGNTFDLKQWTPVNSLLEPVTGSNTYAVVADVAVDAAGGRWAANRKTRAPTLRSLVYFPPLDTPQVAFDAADGMPDNDMTVTLLVGNRLWIGYNGRGLGVLDFKGTPALKGDDSIALFTVTSDRLPSDFITALALDRAGYIWVGTPGGLARIDPQFYPFIVVEPAQVEPAGPEILALVADQGNQLWVGTGHGLARIPDGALAADSFWFAGPTPLPDNRVWSLALDSTSARLWIGTANGVARLPLLARVEAPDDEELGVFPSPLVLRSAGDIATFEVPFGARIDIFNVAGLRVRSLSTGNTWDGRNESGAFVATGLYLVRVTYADGTHRSGRLGVIRER